MKERWLLPDGVDDLLPAQAEVLQKYSHDLMQLCSLWGYRRVYPPLVEFTDALQTDRHADLDTRTCKLVDQASGRLLGVRSDFSPSLARIYSRSLRGESPVRLCYFGELLHAQTSPQGRVPLRVGAELFGCGAAQANAEIICLLERCLEACGVTGHHWVIGHAGIPDRLLADYPAAQREMLFDALQQKDLATIRRHGDARLLALCDLYGDIGSLDGALDGADFAEFADMIAEVRQVAGALRSPGGGSLSYDLGEVHGCNYHTGLVFALYVDGLGQPLARGGRYDEMASEYGYEVSATGFDLDLRALLDMLPGLSASPEQRVYAPWDADDGQLHLEVQRLRDDGICVIHALPGDGGARAMQCGRELRRDGDAWQLREPDGDG